ncbi:PelA/Pel-15E family pectate lyase [Arcicella aurantiaca]|uniref:PelA/Pel-15E family pectate lyase n=1 Tax=Arcicella aurantiaca TaxID=591202 RepID=A0A316DIP1_9BACT|nr:pectate lyase [Arcicella aurantiaca]PWK18127.1 PelA/Pel-15E family pectate lyase [Arcicella aurantiaca]
MVKNVLFIASLTFLALSSHGQMVTDSTAEKMLLYQRNNGGFPQPHGDPIKYDLAISEKLKATLLAEKPLLDATIDDQATTREIKGLASAYQKTQNPVYLKAVENGINYLITAQNSAGGWGQFYPDSSGYHKHITYNDNAMIDVMWIMKYASECTHDFEKIDKKIAQNAKIALEKGIQCILKTQVVQNGKLTAWCAQHDRKTLKPAKARMFELPSLSGNESVGITRFLMSIDKPSAEIKKSIQSAVEWLESVKIVGIKTKDIPDASQPKGKDRIVVEDPNSVVWARFYELDTNKPFFVGRNSIPKSTLAEIENERRVGYAYYGVWAKALLEKDYPIWKTKWK